MEDANETTEESLSKEELAAFPLVEVWWYDHEGNGGPGWEEITEQLKWAAEPVVVAKTVGYMIYECETHIVTIDTIMEGGQCGTANKIVKNDIIKERVLDYGRSPIEQTEGSAD